MSGVIVKIGGSVFSDKTKAKPKWYNEPGFGADFNKEILVKILAEIKVMPKVIALVFGAGSFGHPAAAAMNLNADTYTKVDQDQLRQLNQNLKIMAEDYLLPLVPKSLIAKVHFPTLIVDDAGGVRIVSGDEVVAKIAKQTKAEEIVFYSDCLPDFAGEMTETIESKDLKTLIKDLSYKENLKIDATGGMAGKLMHLSDLDLRVRFEVV